MPPTPARPQDLKLGELLVTYQLISRKQLEEARRLQDQSGERLGSLLVELDFISVEVLLESLGRQYGRPTVNLFETDISAKFLDLIPLEKMKKHRAIPYATTGQRICLAMVNPNDMAATKELQFILGMSVDPHVAPSFQVIAALSLLEKMQGGSTRAITGRQVLQNCTRKVRIEGQNAPEIEELLGLLLQEDASDLLLVAGVPPSIKQNNEVRRLTTSLLTPQQVKAYAQKLMSETQLKRFIQEKELDYSLTIPELGRFRINVYRQRNSFSIAVRPIVEEIPSPEKLRLPPWLADIALKSQGLILLTGPAGHGKTTTLAAIVDIINSRCKKNIITIEDPIEYLHRHKSSNVNQREVGTDTDSFEIGLRHVLREAPDVIVIGEMRDPQSFAIALQAADTGHLVISCMHANNAILAISRIIDVFPPEQQRQIRVQLADNFLLILNQRLVARKNGKGRVLAYEKLTNSHRIRNLIREGKEHQIRSLMQQSMEDFQSIDLSLARLCIEGDISTDAAMYYSQDESFFNDLLRRGRGLLTPGTAPK